MTPTEISYCLSLAAKNRDTIGFVPKPRFELDCARGRVRLQRLNGEPCGYLYHSPFRAAHPMHIVQAVIQLDARRMRCATDLVLSLLADAAAASMPCVTLRCYASHLPQNAFWDTFSFGIQTLPYLGTRRKEPLVRRTLWLARPSLSVLQSLRSTYKVGVQSSQSLLLE